MHSDNSFNKSLFDICQAMVSALELREVLDTILDLSIRTLRASAGSILLCEPGSDSLKMLASRGLPPGVVARGHISRKGSIADRVLAENRPAIINSPQEQEGSNLNRASAIKSALCVPLRAKGEVIGTLNLNRYDEEQGPYGEQDLRTVMILASQAAVSIENARLHEENVANARMAAIGQTVAGISHCIKNVLTGLRGGLGLVEMAQEARNWEASEKGCRVLRRNVERVSLLVLDMLDYSRDKTPSRRDTVVHSLVDEVFEVVYHKAKKQGVVLAQEIAQEGEHIFADADQMFRCLLNLVENAIESIPGEGRVTVRCGEMPWEEAKAAGLFRGKDDLERTERIVRITVEDTGAGIGPENLENVFQPFFSTKASRGTGLGLAVTRKITREHGGDVLVESELGRGTSFRLVFPETRPES
ncbi:MAG TPA: ATP-binding protein [Sumerlaeia bacterium]|nr:ATP-binding protein [Sumerlaeia bacterium]